MSKKYNEIEVKDNMKVEVDEIEETEVGEKKQLKSVVSVKPTKVKRSLFGRLVTGVVGPDGLPGIGTYVNEEIVKPAIKNIIVDAVTSGINMVMYGERGGAGAPRHRVGGHSSHRPMQRPVTNYNNSFSRGSSRVDSHPPERVVPARGGVQEYLIEDRLDAVNVIATLTDNADRYGTVSVADYYDLIGVDTQYTDNNYGWSVETIHRAIIQPVRGGFVIKFPMLEVI